MKAKQYAERFLAAPHDLTLLINILDEIVSEVVKVAVTRKSTPSMVGCVREGFSKWKAVVSLVQQAEPECPIDIGFFPKMLAVENIPLYTVSVENKIFLGYTLDKGDLARFSEGQQKVAKANLLERLASLHREARALGLPIGALL